MSEWQPIQTAPKDGTEILAWNGESRTAVAWRPGAYHPGGGWWSLVETGGRCEDGEFYDPTHWQPLPEPPAISAP